MNNSYLMGYYLGYMEKAAVTQLPTGNQNTPPPQEGLTPPPAWYQNNIPAPGKQAPVPPPENAKAMLPGQVPAPSTFPPAQAPEPMPPMPSPAPGLPQQNQQVPAPAPRPVPRPAPPWMYNYGGAQ